MTNPINWPEAQRICDIPEIHEALSAFSQNSTEDNAVGLICAVLNAAGTFTQGRAAGLEEERAAFAAWAEEALESHYDEHNSFCSYDKDSAWLAWQARAALSPISSDAGKDDARDAARYRWIAEQGSLRDEFRSPDFARVCQFFNDLGGQLLGEAIDEAMNSSALSSLEVIGKGEKG